MLVTLVHELRRRGGGIGVAAMCAGGGMGSATVIEVLAPWSVSCRLGPLVESVDDVKGAAWRA
jgi:hypothetical protein